MRKGLSLFLSLVFSLGIIVIKDPTPDPPALGPHDSGDLEYTRQTEWYDICGPDEDGCHFELADTSGWQIYDANCFDSEACTAEAGIKVPVGVGEWGEPCAGFTGASGFDLSDNGSHDDGARLECLISEQSGDQTAGGAPAQSILYLRAGTYNFTATATNFWIDRSELVVRGSTSGGGVIFKSHFSGPAGAFGGGGPMCKDAPHFLVCGTNGMYGGESNPKNMCGSCTWNETDWTAEYTPGTKTITLDDASQLGPPVAGEWLILVGDVPTNLTQGDETEIGEIKKVASVSGNNITFDTGIRHDWDLSANRVAWKILDVIHSVGIENIRFEETDLTVANRYYSTLSFHTVVESWMTGCAFGDAYSHNFRIESGGGSGGRSPAARILVKNNVFDGELHSDESASANRAQMLHRKSFENVIENNYFMNDARPYTIEDWASGNIIAYNFIDAGGPDTDGKCKAGIFLHGDYPAENLFEGNQINREGITPDAETCNIAFEGTWASHGPRNMIFRNRIEAGTGGILDSAQRVFKFGGGRDPVAPDGALIGNIQHECSSDSTEYDDSWTADLPWLERNVTRGDCRLTAVCEADSTCDVNNVEGVESDPNNADWNNMSVPHSFYRNNEPPWWCTESCDWDDIHTGIGAWGDDFDGTLCEIPAKRAYDGDACS